MGFNTDPTRHALPRGRILYARKSTAGVLGPFLHLGNCSKFEFSTMGDSDTDVVDFTTSSGAVATRIETKRVPEFGISLYEWEPNNLALALMAAAPNELTQANTAITGEVMQGGAKIGALYQTNLYGPITGVVVKKGATVFTVNTHYIVRDANVGLIEIVALPGGVLEGDAITVDYTPTAYVTGSGFKQIKAGTLSKIEGYLRYIGTSTVGPRHQLDIFNCSVMSDGSAPFLATDVAEFGLKITVLSNSTFADLFRLTELSNGAGAPMS